MKIKARKFKKLATLVEENFFPFSSKDSFYKSLLRNRLLRPENGFYQWGQNSEWVLDVTYIPKVQEIFLIKGSKKNK